jgi:uncharacterized membrane protein YccF (DUF307 family)
VDLQPIGRQVVEHQDLEVGHADQGLEALQEVLNLVVLLAAIWLVLQGVCGEVIRVVCSKNLCWDHHQDCLGVLLP